MYSTETVHIDDTLQVHHIYIIITVIRHIAEWLLYGHTLILWAQTLHLIIIHKMIGLFNENVGLYSSIVVRVHRSNILNLDIAIQIIVHNAFAIIDGRTFLVCI